MTSLDEFFKEEEIITEHGIYKYKDKRKRCKIHEGFIVPKQTPQIIKDIYDIVFFLSKNGVSVRKVDYPVLVTIIQRYIGYSKTWSYIIASAIITLDVVLGQLDLSILYTRSE